MPSVGGGEHPGLPRRGRETARSGLAAVAGQLPGTALLADLRRVPAPAWIPFPGWLSEARYRRFHGGGFLTVIPWPKQY